MYLQYKDDELKKVHAIQKEILEEFSEFCKKYNLEYFLLYGTALGAQRHKGFIPWDDDIDVGMLREDYDKFISLAVKEFNPDYEILTPLINKHYCSTVTHLQKKNTTFISEYAKNIKCHLGINIDIFALDKVPNDTKKKIKQSRLTYFWGRLLFLRGSGRPEIPYKGVIGMSFKIICLLVHYFLVIFNISPKWIYCNLLKISKRYNSTKSTMVTTFEDANPLKYTMDLNEIFPLKEILFEDILIHVPNKNHEILIRHYGDYMKLPPLEQRVNHAPIVLKFDE